MLKIKLPQAFFLFLFFWFEQFSYAQDNFFNLYTEDYAPYNMPKDDTNGDNENEIVGSATDIMKEIFKRANIKYKMELLPWARAYNNALTKKMLLFLLHQELKNAKNCLNGLGRLAKTIGCYFH